MTAHSCLLTQSNLQENSVLRYPKTIKLKIHMYKNVYGAVHKRCHHFFEIFDSPFVIISTK